jgi:hypothetical protein
MDGSYLEIPFVALDEPLHSDAVPLQRPEVPIRESAVRSVEQPVPVVRPAIPVVPPQVDIPEEEPSIVAILRESAMRNSPPQNAAAQSLPEKHSKAASRGELVNARSWALLLLGFASLCLIAAVMSAGLYFGLPALRARLHGTPEQGPRLGLDFQVTRAADGQLNLNWNRSAPQVLESPSALLTITDGRRTNKLNLDNAQLRSGKLMYLPKNDDVQFRLELNTDNLHTVAESVRILSAAAEAGHARRSRYGQGVNEFGRGTFPSGPAGRGEFPPYSTQVDVNPERIPANGASDTVPLLLPSRALPPLVTATTWSSTAPPPPATAYVPPRVVEEMMPETTPVGQYARISVQVSIDRGGYVTAAHALKNEGTINEMLAEIATAAAQRWRFEPATLNGKPIPAEYRIVFAFHRQMPE